MAHYVFRRILLMIPTVLLVVFLTVFVQRLVPGSTIDVMMENNPSVGAQRVTDRKLVEEALGLDQPIPIQFFRYMKGVLRGDLGTSLWTQRSVGTLIGERVAVTLELAALSLMFSTVFGIGLGVISGVRAGRPEDFALRAIAIVGLSVPNFALGVMVLVLPAMWWGWVPSVGYVPLTEDPLRNILLLIAPTIILGLGISASILRFTRTMILEVVRYDYVRTARAKGLDERTVIVRHVLRNALIPVVTILGLQISTALGGSVIVEQLFALRGLGQLLLQAINQRDYPIVQGITIFVSSWIILVNLVVDLSYGFLDPRIRLGSK